MYSLYLHLPTGIDWEDSDISHRFNKFCHLDENVIVLNEIIKTRLNLKTLENSRIFVIGQFDVASLFYLLGAVHSHCAV